MEGTRYRTEEQILARARAAVGIPFREMDRTGRLSTGKGAVGSVLEESWFGYRPNSDAAPDFPEAGVELKVTPWVRGRDGAVHAKERLVCDIIDYEAEPLRTFETSAFRRKCAVLLLMTYEHREGVPKGDLSIDAAALYRIPEEDLAVMRRDWETVMGKVRAGRAHEISEGDTLYLAACTKGEGPGTWRRQPYSDEPAKQRAWCLKRSYMDQVLRERVFGRGEGERIGLRGRPFEAYVLQRLAPWYGKGRTELRERLGVESRAKHLNEILLSRMLGVRGRIGRTEEFRRAGIVPKTVRVRRDGWVRESVSLPAFDPIRLSEETEWEGSELYQYLAPARFLSVVFREDGQGDWIFERAKFWALSPADLDEAGQVWEAAVWAARFGTAFPKKNESPVAHVRPHARDAADVCQIPDGRWMTKQSFWLNNDYIARQIGGTP